MSVFYFPKIFGHSLLGARLVSLEDLRLAVTRNRDFVFYISTSQIGVITRLQGPRTLPGHTHALEDDFYRLTISRSSNHGKR